MLSEEIWKLWLVILTKIGLWEVKILPSNFTILPYYPLWRLLVFGSILHVDSFWYWLWVLQWIYNHYFSLYGRNREPRIPSKDFTSQIQIKTFSIILLIVQLETRNANCYQLYLFCKHSKPKCSDSQGSREHLFHYLLKAQPRAWWLRVMGTWLCRRVLWWLSDCVPSKQFKP